MEVQLNKKLYYLVKNNSSIESIKYDKLYKLYFYILFRLKIENAYLLFKSYILYLDELDKFNKMVSTKELRKYVLNMMTNFDLTNYIDKDINLNSNIKYPLDDLLLNMILENPSKEYLIEIKDSYIESINKLKETIKTTSDEALKIYSKEEIFEITFNNDKINTKEVDILIINNFTSNIDSYFRFIKKFNNPELLLYNYLVSLKDKYKEILYIFNHFTLPICRIKKHHLYADILMLFNIKNCLVYAIIEYDGATHYDPSYYLFNKDCIRCDIIKNNFCRANNINLLRITELNYNIIDSFIKNIINGDHIIICQPYTFYKELL